ncbi:unnamed protein product [Menidia menidia]|uniref:(Atlantic silverside) hypothetical protein n=1 Tax=Menidia menidia TaxID=238744 RepID=A0A8S4BMH0_9TELE|nr:unnamed protein product [Menidia menidia]
MGRMIVPLELNYCQCMLELEEYYEVIEHTTEVLEKHKDCVKGYYKRAKAHAAVWDEKEARRDFNMVAQLDITLASLVRRELKDLSERMKEKYWEEKEQYWSKLDAKEKIEEDAEPDNEGKEEENEVESKQEGSESPTTATKDNVVEENSLCPPKCAEVAKVELEETRVVQSEGVKAEASCLTIIPNTGEKAEEKDWQQMLRLVMFLQNEGNAHIKEKRFQEASVKFEEALEYVESLQNKVDPEGEDRESLEKVRLPLTLNLSQCMLELKQYQRVVELNSKLLKRHKGNFKAVYQRARAHASLCNEDEARRDFALVEKLDPKFKPFVRQELKKLCESVRSMHAHQNKTYWDATKEKWGPGGSKAPSAARKRNVQRAQKAAGEKTDEGEKCEVSEVQEEGGSEEQHPAEKEAQGEAATEKNPREKAERSNKEPDCGRASGEEFENENSERVVAPEAGPGGPDNSPADKNSDPAAPSSGKDNVASKRSVRDKGRKKVKSQSSGAPNPSRTSGKNKAPRGKASKSGSFNTDQ